MQFIEKKIKIAIHFVVIKSIFRHFSLKCPLNSLSWNFLQFLRQNSLLKILPFSVFLSKTCFSIKRVSSKMFFYVMLCSRGFSQPISTCRSVAGCLRLKCVFQWLSRRDRGATDGRSKMWEQRILTANYKPLRRSTVPCWNNAFIIRLDRLRVVSLITFLTPLLWFFCRKKMKRKIATSCNSFFW